MKKVVLIVTIERTALLVYRGFLQYLRDHGWEVSVVARSNGALEDWAAREGAKAYSVGFERAPSLFKDAKALLDTYRLLRKIRPNVVVSATPKAGMLGTLAGKLAGIPVRIYQLWGLRLETEHGLKKRFLLFLERLTAKASTQLVANSPSLAALSSSLGINKAGAVKVLGAGSSHGVDLERFDPLNAVGPDPDTRRFLDVPCDLSVIYLGRITRDKGVETLIEAVEGANRRGVSIRLLLVGRIEDGDLAEKFDELPEYIHVRDRVEGVAPYISSVDLLCLPTLREGFPNVVLEAAAMEVPAVVSDATGSVDSVEEGKTGWIFPVGDADTLTNTFISIANRPEEISRRGKCARERVETLFAQSLIWHLQLENIEEQLSSIAPQSKASD